MNEIRANRLEITRSDTRKVEGVSLRDEKKSAEEREDRGATAIASHRRP